MSLRQRRMVAREARARFLETADASSPLPWEVSAALALTPVSSATAETAATSVRATALVDISLLLERAGDF